VTIRIESVTREHRALLATFQNQHPSLVEYLTRFALRHAEKDLLSRTYLAVDGAPLKERLVGYFSLSTVSVERASVATIPDLDKLPRFPIPGLLLARLAVDSRAQGQGVGAFLFEEALGLTLQLVQTGPVAFRVLVTDAIDDNAARFYEHFGLVRLAPVAPCRMVLDLKPVLRKP
jgi:GNAT superfamily N-acetyltransferase